MQTQEKPTTQEVQAKEHLLKKCIVVLAGLPLSGKSSTGKKLAESSNLVLLDVDETRYSIFPHREERLDPKSETFAMRTSYQKNHELATQFLEKGLPVVLVATYSTPIYHEMLKNLSQKNGCPLRTFFLDVPENTLKERLEKRGNQANFSNIRKVEDLLEVASRYQRIEDVGQITIKADKDTNDIAQQIFESLDDLKA